MWFNLNGSCCKEDARIVGFRRDGEEIGLAKKEEHINSVKLGEKGL